MQGFVLRLLAPRPDFATTMTDDERATMSEHVAYWTGQAEEGHVLAFGPVADPAGLYGIAIVLAEDGEEAERIRDGDPALTSPHGFRTELTPMVVLVTPEGRHDALYGVREADRRLIPTPAREPLGPCRRRTGRRARSPRRHRWPRS